MMRLSPNLLPSPSSPFILPLQAPVPKRPLRFQNSEGIYPDSQRAPE